MEKGIFEAMEEFLDYLAKNDHNVDRREEKNLIKKFGKENYDRIYSLLVGDGRIGSLTIRKEKERINRIHINGEGLKFLEERQKEKRYEENQRVMLFLTAMLVITTIASFFNGLEQIKPIFLSVIYALFATLIWAYFKTLKKI